MARNQIYTRGLLLRLWVRHRIKRQRPRSILLGNTDSRLPKTPHTPPISRHHFTPNLRKKSQRFFNISLKGHLVNLVQQLGTRRRNRQKSRLQCGRGRN